MLVHRCHDRNGCLVFQLLGSAAETCGQRLHTTCPSVLETHRSITTSDSPGSLVYLGSVRVEPWLLLRCICPVRGPRPLAALGELAEGVPLRPLLPPLVAAPAVVGRTPRVPSGAKREPEEGLTAIVLPPALLGRLLLEVVRRPGPASSSADKTRGIPLRLDERDPEPLPPPEARSCSAVSVIAWPDRARAFAAWSVRTGSPVLSTSSAVTRLRFGAAVLGGEGARRTARGGVGRADVRVGERADGPAIVRLGPRSCSTVMTRGAFLPGL